MSEFEQELAKMRQDLEPKSPILQAPVSKTPEEVQELINLLTDVTRLKIAKDKINTEKYNVLVSESDSDISPILETVNALFLNGRGKLLKPTEKTNSTSASLMFSPFTPHLLDSAAKMDLSTNQISINPKFESYIVNPGAYIEYKEKIEEIAKELGGDTQRFKDIEAETKLEWRENVHHDSVYGDYYSLKIDITNTGLVVLKNIPKGGSSFKPFISIYKDSDPNWKPKIQKGIVYLLQNQELIKFTKIKPPSSEPDHPSYWPVW